MGQPIKAKDGTNVWRDVKCNANGELQIVGGSSSMEPDGPPEHFNGDAGVAAATLTTTNDPAVWLIVNKETVITEVLLVSFDDGSNWFSIPAGANLEVSTTKNDIQLKRGAAALADVAYEVLVTTRI